MRVAPVFELVKTLSPAQIKLLGRRSEPHAAFITLLKIMQQAPQKEEALFKKQFLAIHPGIDFTETKSYLYQFLLRHLTELSHEESLIAEITYSFATAEAVANRHLHKESLAIYKAAKQKADEAGFFQLSAVALKRMQNILFKSARTDKDYSLLQQLANEEAAAIEKDKAASISMQLYVRFVQLVEKYGGPTTPAVLKQFQEIAEHPVIQQREKLPSKQARLIAFDLLTNYYRFTNQSEKFISISQQELKFYTPALLKDPYYAYRYVFMLHNLIGLLPSSRKRVYRALLSKAPTPNENTINYKKLFLIHAALSEADHMPEAAFKKLTADTITELKKDWLQQKPKERMDLVFGFLKSLIARKDYNTAAQVIIPELNNKALEKALPPQYVGLRLFYLLTLLEQRNFSLMESPLRSLQYALQRAHTQNKVAKELAPLFLALMRQAASNKIAASISKVEEAVRQTPHFANQGFGLNIFIESRWYQKLKERYHSPR